MDTQNAKLRELRGELMRFKKERDSLRRRIHMLETECAQLRAGGQQAAVSGDRHNLFFDMFLERYPGVLAVLDTELHYLLGTDSAIRRLFCLPPHLIMEGVRFSEIYKSAGSGAWTNTLAERCAETLETQKTLRYTDSAVLTDGTRRELVITLMPAIGQDAAMHGVIFHIHNHAEHCSTLCRAEEVLEEKSAYLERLSLDLRALLDSLCETGRLLAAAQTDSAKLSLQGSQERLAEIERAVSGEIGRTERSPDSIESSYTLRELLKDIVVAHSAHGAKSDSRLLMDVDPALPSAFVGDNLHIKQVLMCILSGALKDAAGKSVILRVSGTFRIDGRCMLSFSVFSNAEGQGGVEQESFEGTPLDNGVLRVARSMSGELHAENVPGHGIVRTLTLPQRVSDRDVLASVDAPEKKHVLLYGESPVLDSIAVMLDRLSVRHTGAAGDWAHLLDGGNFTHLIFPDGCEAVNDDFTAPDGLFAAQLRPTFATGAKTLSFASDSLFEPVIITDLAAFLNQRAAEKPAAPPAVAPGKIHALVVDDNEINLIIAAEMLSQFNVETDTADSGAAALEKAAHKDYDIIFMDHLMLGMDGVETTLQLRAMPGRAASVPVIALTANASMGAKDYFLQNGMNDYLAKPMELPLLLAVLEKWLPGWLSDHVPQIRQNGSGAYLRSLRTKLGLDTAAAMNRIGNNEGAYINVLDTFARTTPHRMSTIERAAAEHDWDAFRVGVHGQKSSLANIGAVSLAQDARNLEQAAINKNYTYIEGLTPSFCQQVNSLASQITELEPQKEDAAALPAALPGDFKRLREGLARTAALIEDLDSGTAVHVLRGLSSRRYDPVTDHLLSEIRHALELFGYTEAEQSLDELNKHLAVTG